MMKVFVVFTFDYGESDVYRYVSAIFTTEEVANNYLKNKLSGIGEVEEHEVHYT